ncbi:MAG: hypothetical protein E7C95_05480 [Anaerococcus prevotii]|uniref:hypothetical protein n=1 Tax=Anaerococcus prevotii TaxID=33034 RepID=UPI0029023A16|nr:hypothetical protein [Anaerococcus prevotii]MDU2558415.1 hypothetical protein [Anaerococcus prevotii]
MKKDKSIIYRASLLIGLVIFIISFAFRYSYIDILGFDRPLKLASFILMALGLIGSISALIDGVNKDFAHPIILLLVLNVVMIFTYPILLGAETFITQPTNPYEDRSPNKGKSTRGRDDASFIIEGEIYSMPVRLKDFKDRGFSYKIKEDEEGKRANIRRLGESTKKKPTWFTDGEVKDAFKEFYLLEAFFEDTDISEDTPITHLKASVINNNRDFEVMGIKLEDSIEDVKKNFKGKIEEDPGNKENPSKKYYLVTKDSYKITLSSLKGVIQSIEISKID